MADKLPGAVGRVHESLRASILAREHLPGERLDRGRIADSLGVSRTPVREALAWLQDEGFVEVRPRSGTVVSPIDVLSLHEGHFLLLAMSVEAAGRLAARREARALTAETREAFLASLFVGVGMARLYDRVASYLGAVERCRALGCAGDPQAERELRRNVLARIAAGDRDGAAASMRALLAGDLEPLGRWRTEFPEMFGEEGRGAVRKAWKLAL